MLPLSPAVPAQRWKKKVAILQSNYIPWKGYIDIIRSVDEFIIFDDVQFTRRDWRNRNQIKTASGLLWLTIPVVSKSRYTQLICETEIADSSWAEQHWLSIHHNYAKAPYFTSMGPRLQRMLERASQEKLLSTVNHLLLKELCALLGVTTPLTWAMDYAVEGQKTDRLLALCQAAGADYYLSGPAAKAYMEEHKFADANIAVDYMNYNGYPEYPQQYGAFEHKVSVIDALMMCGDHACNIFVRDGALV